MTAPDTADTPLLRLVYVSDESASMVAEMPEVRRKHMEDITQIAITNNQNIGVTGALVHGGGRFLQVLQGPDAIVRGLFAKISADPRHCSVKVLSEAAIDEVDIWSWGMYVLPAEAPEDLSMIEEVAGFFTDEEFAAFEGTRPFSAAAE